jgi:hypothetical protein
MQLHQSATETELFRACTTITAGNGMNTKFWLDHWLQGHAPKDLAPTLDRLAWRKNIGVAEAMTEDKWMRGLQRISTTAEINQFVQLWSMTRQMQLSTQDDSISWRFTSHGCYSTRSAYKMQFAGSVADFEWDDLWKSKVENKCKFFSWLILRNKL